MLKRLVVAGLFVVAGFAVGHSAGEGPRRFGPFRLGQEPKMFAMQDCRELARVETASGTLVRFELPAQVVLEILLSAADGSLVATMKAGSATGAVLLPPTTLSGAFIGGVRVRAALLNEDGIVDGVIETVSGGCGLAGEIGFRTFLLSDGARYVAVPVELFTMRDDDFIDLDHDGRPEMIHTAFVYGEEGIDGRAHNYWVFNLLEFNKNRITSVNARNRAFPVWVQYKFQPNHSRTDQLSAEQRVRLWRAADHAWFPGWKALANEQRR